ncbi:cob(I)yrinic acid a,c-diamide adenosyltransferase [Lederbergia galactosidilytica]|uniref:Corrinoid adenosyltransferase n=1 Tax=Lederbergia galactosidilytica TaxID=217031 RepID=A0A178A8P4_9BACI|nr:cob(I)yrinic acid a,c-diamide adenosyltransferase [Lederbergia galactosidilytica]KRG10554.1 cob(I)yrinic acid a c-diamide adenosyltransferase [Virgibacillus soli]MBP1916499.1 cob(I)alamin adenosyltransferase [Lederbergia galactosidilytica]OAK75408.1 cob(I)yrinic acid a c-diamide adenosyltransferase [Lederbergia galactosidilytica]
MKIYTKTGDKGTTSLVYGTRISKHDIRVDAYGTCDEANSMIGLALSYLLDIENDEVNQIKENFHKIQTMLFHVGAELSTPPEKEVAWKVTEKDVLELEKMIDQWEGKIPPLNKFILPGGHPAGAALHTARTVVRRAERLAVAVELQNKSVLPYLNRLSDLLFVAARYVNHILGYEEMQLHD